MVMGCIVILYSCSQNEAPPETAFYHWQTRLSLDVEEQTWLDSTATQRVYVKFFDIAWEGKPVPSAELQRAGTWREGIEVVPTLYVTNETMRELGKQTELEQSLATLTQRCLGKINTLWPELHYTELQIDCDWTKTTRATYFAWLKQLKAALPLGVDLSATIRLHQYRYPEQTGVPPVDRGMLMYYNMGELSSWQETNSILNLTAAAPYLAVDGYELPLDIALPLYRWGTLYRNGQLLKLINGLHSQQLADTTYYQIIDVELEPKKARGESRVRGAASAQATTGEAVRSPALGGASESGARGHDNRRADVGRPNHARYEVRKSTYLDGYYLYEGDLLRLEWIDRELLRQAAEQAQQVATAGRRYVAYYHLDSTMLEAFDYDDIRTTTALLGAAATAMPTSAD